MHSESIVAIKVASGFVVAGISWLGYHIVAMVENVDPIPSTLLEYGFAGMFIAALIYALRHQSNALKAERERSQTLEKEIREELKEELQNANSARAEMITIMKAQSNNNKPN
jgi:hypothetical protein